MKSVSVATTIQRADLVISMKPRPGVTRKCCQTSWYKFFVIQIGLTRSGLHGNYQISPLWGLCLSNRFSKTSILLWKWKDFSSYSVFSLTHFLIFDISIHFPNSPLNSASFDTTYVYTQIKKSHEWKCRITGKSLPFS